LVPRPAHVHELGPVMEQRRELVHVLVGQPLPLVLRQLNQALLRRRRLGNRERRAGEEKSESENRQSECHGEILSWSRELRDGDDRSGPRREFHSSPRPRLSLAHSLSYQAVSAKAVGGLGNLAGRAAGNMERMTATDLQVRPARPGRGNEPTAPARKGLAREDHTLGGPATLALRNLANL